MISGFNLVKKRIYSDFLRIDAKGNVRAGISILSFRDKDTRQMVVYAPSLEVTGYGPDQKKATEMIKFSIDDFFKYLLKLSQKKREAELLSLDWKRNVIRNKEFSKAFVDFSGQLQNLNAVENKVDRLTLLA